jgi:hypothetical protein
MIYNELDLQHHVKRKRKEKEERGRGKEEGKNIISSYLSQYLHHREQRPFN